MIRVKIDGCLKKSVCCAHLNFYFFSDWLADCMEGIKNADFYYNICWGEWISQFYDTHFSSCISFICLFSHLSFLHNLRTASIVCFITRYRVLLQGWKKHAYFFDDYCYFYYSYFMWFKNAHCRSRSLSP